MGQSRHFEHNHGSGGPLSTPSAAPHLHSRHYDVITELEQLGAEEKDVSEWLLHDTKTEGDENCYLLETMSTEYLSLYFG